MDKFFKIINLIYNVIVPFVIAYNFLTSNKPGVSELIIGILLVCSFIGYIILIMENGEKINEIDRLKENKR